ncbi:MAG TPA: pyridoxal-phosphate dependent enzyme [Candidatus Cybelea sp.]|nr:pyridoxal-phosphate dependent enzyme [Candidatus Cybelea sp.]
MSSGRHAVFIGRDAIEAARRRIAGIVVRTPLIKLEAGGAPIFLKLENLQPINSFKLRGALNAVAMLSPERRSLGVWTASAGNAGQGLAYAARLEEVPCTVVAPETAPATKLQRMRALGAKLIEVSYDEWWRAMEQRAFPGIEGTFISPFDNDDFIAGNATIGLEIIEDLPEVETIIAPVGGGGLLTGVALGARARKPNVRVFGAEPETAAPLALSFANGKPSAFTQWQPSFVDGAGGKSCFPQMWERLQPIVDGSIVVSLDETKRALRLLAEKTRVIAEGAGALAVAAALGGKVEDAPIAAIVSGGNIELSTFCELLL